MTIFALGVKHWRPIAGGLGLATLLLLLASARADSRHWQKEAERYAGLYRSERLAHQGTIANYRRAAELARARDAANAARVERDQTVITKEVAHDYAEKLAALRSRYDALRLRGQGGAAAADPGAGGIAPVPQAGPGAGGVAAPADQAGLSLDDRFLCSAQAEQLDALITWVERQQAVSVNTDAPPG